MTKVLLLLLLIPICVLSQKRIEKTYEAKDIKSLHIRSDAIFKIDIVSKPVQHIAVLTIIDGETYESSLLHTNVVNNELKITTGRTPDFTPYNDKLSAHKVLSIEVALIVPDGLNVEIYSTLAAVRIQGNYENLSINLGRGGVMGEELRFRESVINTLSGKVALHLQEATVTAQSRNGKTSIDPIFNQGPSCIIQSIYGDIEVLQVD